MLIHTIDSAAIPWPLPINPIFSFVVALIEIVPVLILSNFAICFIIFVTYLLTLGFSAIIFISKFIYYCRNKLKEEGFSIVNLDINIIAEKPKINKYVSKMINQIAKLLKIETGTISIKATTNEKIGFIGKGQGIAAESIVHISNDKFN